MNSVAGSSILQQRFLASDERATAAKTLHPLTSLIPSKLAIFEKLTTEAIVNSLGLGLDHCLKCRPDGTVLDGHHRLYVLSTRGININALPREVIQKDK